MAVELIHKSPEFRSQNLPKSLNKVEIKTIGTWAFISPTTPNSFFNLLVRKRGNESLSLSLVNGLEEYPIKSRSETLVFSKSMKKEIKNFIFDPVRLLDPITINEETLKSIVISSAI